LPGVSLALAESRAATISDLRYDVTLDVPAERDSAVTGTVTARFTLRGTDGPLVLDFRAPAANVGRVTLDGDSVPYRVVPDHIVIPAGRARAGAHALTVSFRSTDAALNRNDDFLYALFVPDRASTAIPVFEQPDLKARFTLALTIPARRPPHAPLRRERADQHLPHDVRSRSPLARRRGPRRPALHDVPP
jgi:aminopeptidase N